MATTKGLPPARRLILLLPRPHHPRHHRWIWTVIAATTEQGRCKHLVQSRTPHPTLRIDTSSRMWGFVYVKPGECRMWGLCVANGCVLRRRGASSPMADSANLSAGRVKWSSLSLCESILTSCSSCHLSPRTKGRTQNPARRSQSCRRHGHCHHTNNAGVPPSSTSAAPPRLALQESLSRLTTPGFQLPWSPSSYKTARSPAGRP